LTQRKDGLRYPSIDALLGKINSKYKLAYAASRVAHIIEKEKLDVKYSQSVTSVGQALEEIINGKVTITFEE